MITFFRPRQKSSSSQGRSHSTVLRRVAVALAIALAVPVAAAATPAQADTMTIGGPNSYSASFNVTWKNTPGHGVIAVECGPGRIRINPTVNVQNGYVNGQYIAWRYWYKNNLGWAGTSAWGGGANVPYVGTNNLGKTVYYAFADLPGTTWNRLPGTYWTVQVQLAYWNGSSYNLSSWLNPTGGYSSPGSTYTRPTCSTI